MSTSAKSVRVGENSMWDDSSDGRVIAEPLAWFPRLLHATPQQRQRVEISMNGLHWDELHEDIPAAGLLAGGGDMSRPASVAA